MQTIFKGVLIGDVPATIAPGTESIAANYPESGIYQKNNMYYLVSKSVGTVYMITTMSFTGVFTAEKEGDKVPQSNTLDDILKIIAVTQKPELAKDLINA